MKARIIEFIDSTLAKSAAAGFVDSLKATIAENQKEPETEPIFEISTFKNPTVFSFEPLELANQITLKMSKVFCKIKPNEVKKNYIPD